jgi:DNA-binding NarL/FixJ family response regulator
MNAETPPARLVIVDRDPLALQWMCDVLGRRFPTLQVCAVFGTATEAAAQAHDHRPEMLVVDADIDGGAGFDLARRWKCGHGGPPCLMRLERENPRGVHHALEAGACGAVLRSESCDIFLEALTSVAMGRTHLSLRATSLLATGINARTAMRPIDDLACLTRREQEIFRLVGSGLNTAAIAARTGCSVKTV